MLECLVDGKLHALGASVLNDGLISWVPAGATGSVPLNCYLVTEQRAGLLIDTSLPIIEDVLVAQARQFDLDSVTLVLTRVVEFDSVGTAELLERVLPIHTVYAHFLPAQWMYFRAGPASTPRGRFESRLLEDRARIVVGGERELTVINARLKLLATAWLFDHDTGTLFTSDSFSHALARDPAQRVITGSDDDTSADHVAEHLVTKFDWLEGADTAPLRAFLNGVFSEFEVRRIAPTYGCILSGADVVQRHRELLDLALRDLGAAA
jgi:flavorubredoxin